MKFPCFAMLALALSAGAATNRLVVAEGPDWVPIDYRRDIVAGSAMDFSSVVAADAPAGKHGWLKNVGGHFEFERLPGVKQRFYGANLTRSANLVDHQTADRLMDRFVRLGYNALRLHQHDDAIMAWTNGVLRLNEAEIDRLDYLVAAAIRRGIYVTTDLYVCRRVAWRQVGVDKDGLVPGGVYMAFVGSHPGIRADWCAAAKLFLDHVNPYTGRRYADEPGMPFLSLANEGAITQSWEGSRSQPFVREAWKRWLGERRAADPERYGKVPDDSAATHADFWKGKGQPTWHEEVYAFAADLERANFTVERDFVRSLGAKALLTSVNYYARSKDFRTLRTELFDYADNHFYVDHPSSFSGVSSAPMNNPAKTFPHELASSASARAPGLPLTITEWNWCPPSRYRNGSGLLVGAMAALQDWDGLWHFDYSSHHYTVDHDYHLTHFQIAADPVLMIVDHAMACLYRRGDMVADPSKVTEDCKTAEKVLRQAVELDSTNGAYAVVTPRTCGLFAEIGRKQAGALEATISGAPAAVWASALDQAADLRDSSRILLVHLTDVASEGAVFTGERLNVEENSGGNRYLARVGRAEVSLQLNHPERYAVWALATDGERRARLKTTVREGRLSFTADVARDRQDGTFLYEIERLSDAPGGCHSLIEDCNP